MKDYSVYSDEALAGMTKNGDTDALDHLLAKYRPLAVSLAGKFHIDGGDREDLIQEGMWGLFRGVIDYRPDRNASFYTFASLCIRRHIYKAVEADKRQKHNPLNTALSLSEITDDKAGISVASGKGPEDILIEQEGTAELMKKINGVLSPMEKEVLGHSLKGMGYRQIAALMNRSDKSVDNALQRVRMKIKKIV